MRFSISRILATVAIPLLLTCTASARATSVVIVGGGLSGVTAAYELFKNAKANGTELKITVIEKEKTAGGRTHTIGVQRPYYGKFTFPQDEGAQLFFIGYDTVFSLVNDFKLNDRLRPFPSVVATVKDGKITKFDQADATTFPKFLDNDSLAKLAALPQVLVGSYPLMFSAPIEDFSKWAPIDQESAGTWMKNNFTQNMHDYLGTVYESWFFQEIDQASLAAYLWQLRVILNPDKKNIQTVLGGTGLLTKTIATYLQKNGVQFKYESAVTSVTERNGQAEIEYTDLCWMWKRTRRIKADFVIVATPGPVSKKILANTEWRDNPIVNGPYASSIVLNVYTEQNWRDAEKYPEIAGLPGMHVPRIEGKKLGLRHGSGIVSLSIESGKSPDHLKMVGKGELFGVHLNNERAKEMLDYAHPWTDRQITQATLEELAVYFPGLDIRKAKVDIKKWYNALPIAYPGKAKDLEILWKTQENNTTSPIYLAGDMTNLGLTSNAANSGKKAAHLILKRINDQAQ